MGRHALLSHMAATATAIVKETVMARSSGKLWARGSGYTLWVAVIFDLHRL